MEQFKTQANMLAAKHPDILNHLNPDENDWLKINVAIINVINAIQYEKNDFNKIITRKRGKAIKSKYFFKRKEAIPINSNYQRDEKYDKLNRRDTVVTMTVPISIIPKKHFPRSITVPFVEIFPTIIMPNATSLSVSINATSSTTATTPEITPEITSTTTPPPHTRQLKE
ncbi:13195_t:CDS:2 [Entrophospora sp. SA101]|nr:13195_t:CDS:2 [Entrophospora sp. SA101]